MKSSVYRIAVAPFILSAVIIYIAFYSVGVVEKNYVSDAAKEYLSSLASSIYDNNSEYEVMTDKLCSEYELKAQTLSILISQLPKTLSEDMTSEELRIASGADEIMISDKNGLIIFSTSPDSEIEYVNEQFTDGLTQKNYCRTAIHKSENGCIFEVAVSRRNESGLIITSFVNTALNEVLTYKDTSYALHRNTAFDADSTSVIDIAENKYIAHTTAGLIGAECIISPERFKNREGYFSYKYQGEPSFVFYEYYDDSTVIMSIISKKNVYTKRTLVLVWMVVLQFVFMLSSVLSIRSYKKDYL